MITIIKLTHTLNEIKSEFENWNELSKTQRDFLESYNEFRITNHGQEMLVYEGRQIIASCSISITYHDKIVIDSIWTKDGQIL